MGAKKIKDLAVVTGTYSDGYGQEKRRYMGCGAIMQNDDGGQFIMLNRYINYASLPNPKGGESILISAFDLKEKQQGSGGQQQASSQQGSGTTGYGSDLDDDVPF